MVSYLHLIDEESEAQRVDLGWGLLCVWYILRLVLKGVRLGGAAGCRWLLGGGHSVFFSEEVFLCYTKNHRVGAWTNKHRGGQWSRKGLGISIAPLRTIPRDARMSLYSATEQNSSELDAKLGLEWSSPCSLQDSWEARMCEKTM